MEDENKKKEIQKSQSALREERILAYWNEKDIFKKTLEKPAPKGTYTFYDGPPFATGTPHYGHILASTIKDAVPRFWTMRGYKIPRRWGWDCHGLPVENLIEKELNLKTKKDIISYGIGKFNDGARSAVMRYADEWRKIIPRLGRFVDMDDDYRTMDASYTETVWWTFKRLYDKGLIYEGFKSMSLCPRCETTLSNFEVAQGYKDITDISVYVKFKIKSQKLNLKNEAQDSLGNVYLIAWTTTPWTLPGNVALAVNPDIEYCKVKITESARGDGVSSAGDLLIVAKSRLVALKDIKYEIVETFKGSDLVGESYESLFDYYSKDSELKNRENGWRVYGADFVTTEDGTGVVHIAPAFGADDYEMLTKHDLPFVQHVTTGGHFKKEVTDFAGIAVKPKAVEGEKDANQKADIEIIKWLAHRGGLFAKEKIVHSYPHCWRCDTPLLNYAASSWFVKVTDLKDKLVAENKKVKWTPPEIGEGRFGNWLSGARDWAISRSRFWGAPIPVWKEEKTGVCHVLGSVGDLKKFSKAKNTYYVMRHGQADNNVKGILSNDIADPYHLTDEGRKQVAETADRLKGVKFDEIFVSPFVRTRETANIVKEKLGWKDEDMHVDERIRELGSGVFAGKSVEEFSQVFPFRERFTKCPEGGETYADIKKRMGDFLYDMESKYSGKTIMIVSHETSSYLLVAAAMGLNREQTLDLRGDCDFMANAECRKIEFSPLPHNAEYELDLHRPYIDDVDLRTHHGDKLMRVQDVFDCWYESGSMPYGEAHYPFENTEQFEPASGLFKKSVGFPADFIAEGVDQTRGWFYSMMVLGVALFGKSPYKRVVVNGLVLAEDGQKMSKSKNNFPDPILIFDKYGVDALRYYLLSSPLLKAEDLNFSEKDVDLINKKIVMRLDNVVSFYKLYETSQKSEPKSQVSTNVLDIWITTRLDELASEITKAMEKYELDKATRPIADFVDDLSTWYLRRSRDRFKGDDLSDKESALNTTRYVLLETAKLIAPFMPFLAEDIYKQVGGAKESVHLEDWPTTEKVDANILDEMRAVRAIASSGLEARTVAKINIRQPLATMEVKSNRKLGEQLVELLKDEVNVKRVVFGADIDKEATLDMNITPELKEEGQVRELLRTIQDLRKEKGLKVGDKATLTVTDDMKDLVSRHEKEIMKATGLEQIEYGDKMEIATP